jgi:hypothetical protein
MPATRKSLFRDQKTRRSERLNGLLVSLDRKADECVREEGVGVMSSPEGGNADEITKKRHASRRNVSRGGEEFCTALEINERIAPRDGQSL